ncbi:capsular biosynthesis protein [Pseudoalteromonas sp. A601]|uniref:cellulose synthase operon protein YhjQ/BcsQ n=1 Tax=Pseudoalteromonas sp. A601 TaxID=1967839 RepID=UPI000B3C44CF|nr:AAA family ATPase [Pseudoalteromonas sp. A601]OUS69053.1 capsular biosynthesis protein [Pseudoalteromonas sp. A601]
MKIIPEQYHELELIGNAIADSEARCITFISLTGGEGSTSACASVAKWLIGRDKSVLIIDLNPLNIFRFGKEYPAASCKWGFDDISCQLKVKQYQDLNLLTIRDLEGIDSAKDKHVINDAILRLKQEYDYILLDMSPALKLNRNNIPLHSLSLCSELTFLTIGLGINNEESLCRAVQELKQAGHRKIKALIGQHEFAPLGQRLMTYLEKQTPKWPRLCTALKKRIKKQKWLFQHY